MSWHEPRGLRTLRESDAWWRDRWAQCRSAEELSERFGIPAEDVVERMRRAGVELRGRPPEGQRVLFALPARVTHEWDVRVFSQSELERDHLVTVEAGTRRQAAAAARAQVEAAGVAVAKARVVGIRRPRP